MKKYTLFLVLFLVFFILFFPSSAGEKIIVIALIFLLPSILKLLKKGGGKNKLVKTFFSLFSFLFVVSCATTQQQVVTPSPTEGTTTVKVTKIGVDERQTPPLSFFLVPETLDVDVPQDKDTPLSVNLVNCKEEVLLVSVNQQTTPRWINIQPAFLVKALEIKRIDFTLMPYKLKEVPKEFSITFKAKESVRSLKLQINVVKSEDSEAVKKEGVQPAPPEVDKKPVEHPKVKEVVRIVLFSVHVASFKKREEALDFVDSMPNLEPKTSMVLYDLGSKGLWYRVLVGLYSTREIASGVARHFKEFFGWSYSMPLQVYEDSFLRGEVKKRKRE